MENHLKSKQLFGPIKNIADIYVVWRKFLKSKIYQGETNENFESWKLIFGCGWRKLCLTCRDRYCLASKKIWTLLLCILLGLILSYIWYMIKKIVFQLLWGQQVLNFNNLSKMVWNVSTLYLKVWKQRWCYNDWLSRRSTWNNINGIV